MPLRAASIAVLTFALATTGSTHCPAATISDYFNNYGTVATNVAGLGVAGGGWAGPWAGSSVPDYAPGVNLTYSAPGYDNSDNETGLEDGAAQQGSDPNVGNSADRSLAVDFTGTIWVSALAKVDGVGRARVAFDAPRVVGPIYGFLWGDGNGLVGGGVTYNNLNTTDTSSPARFSAADTHLMLMRIGIGVTNTDFALWVDPDLTGGDIGLPAPLYNVSASNNVMIGTTLQEVGVGFFGSGAPSGRLIDAVRVSNDIDGFYRVTAVPEPTSLLLASLAVIGLVVSNSLRRLARSSRSQLH
ncbi:MAG: PEP-CTERM sorting domain-containing protein [Pirellulales bacterium]